MKKFRDQKAGLHMALLAVTLGVIVLLGGLGMSPGTAQAAKTTLTAKSKTIYVNGTYKISVKNKKKKSTLFYHSNNTKVAKVNSKGKITGLNKGTARIKVRYKQKGTFHSIGTFKITVKKATLNSSFKKTSSIVGSKLNAKDYLNNINPNATYKISTTNKGVATGNTEGQITALKAGNTTLTIKEVYNKKTRSLGTISMKVSGATMTAETTKMGYDSMINAYDFMENTEKDVIYEFTSDNPALLDSSSNMFVSASLGVGSQTCKVTFTEIRENTTRTIGTLDVVVTENAFLLPEDQNLSIGLGAVLQIGGSEGIALSNRNPDAQYVLKAADTTVLSENLVASAYGTTTVTIDEIDPYDGHTTTLEEILTVTVAPAAIRSDLKKNGFKTMVNGDGFGEYPIINRNHNKLYYYETSTKAVCTASTGGSDANQDFLVLSPLKVGTSTITVFEMDTVAGTKSKVGTFKVLVSEDTSKTPDIDTVTAAELIKTITFTHNNKLYTGNVSSEDLSCNFFDENNVGYLDYGTDFGSLTSGGFNIVLQKTKYHIISIDTTDGYEWILTVSLDITEDTLVEIPISMGMAELNISTILRQIRVSLGATNKSITSTTTMPNDSTMLQFADGNTNFEMTFTDRQYIAAGATEYDPSAENPVALSSLNNVTCAITQNAWSLINKTANNSVVSISQPETDDNANWTFTITFEDGTFLDCNLTLGLSN